MAIGKKEKSRDDLLLEVIKQRVMNRKPIDESMPKKAAVTEKIPEEESVHESRKSAESHRKITESANEEPRHHNKTETKTAEEKAGTEDEKITRAKESVKTPIDDLYNAIMALGKLRVDLAAKQFNVPENRVEEWAKILEENGLIEIHYPAIGKPSLTTITKKEEKQQKHEKKEKHDIKKHEWRFLANKKEHFWNHKHNDRKTDARPEIPVKEDFMKKAERRKHDKTPGEAHGKGHKRL
jgi:hypothetical protein